MDDVKVMIKEKFIKYFNEEPTDFVRSSGRLEIIGNHTDHNHGYAIVAGASLYVISAVKKVENKISLYSENRDLYNIKVEKSNPNPREFSTTYSIIKGIVSKFIDLGYKVGGFKAYVTSEVAAGSGISSSAAFELLVCEILNHLYNNDTIDKTTLAKIGQYAEYYYFGKPCGLLDQIGAAYGGISFVDFNDPSNPIVDNVKFPFDLKIVLTNPGGSHSGLDSYYASIPNDMHHVANVLGKKYLRESSIDDLNNFIKSNSNELTKKEVNRATHFFNECVRVQNTMKAINEKDIDSFIKQINESGYSSSNLLDNTQVPGRFENAPERALQIARKVAPRSGHRVHGGGFMGTIISFCYKDEYDALKKAMIDTFGDNAVIDVFIPPFGCGSF